MKSDVYFVKTADGVSPSQLARAAEKIYEYAGISQRINPGDFIAVKVHVGEKKNTTHMSPEIAAAIVSKIKEKEALPFLVETSTLYVGERNNAVKHIHHANNHGFSIENTGAPFIMVDGLVGDSEVEVKIDGELFESVLIARDIRHTDFLFVISHMTGHIGAGFGAAIKNLGMGLASRKGKMRQHSSVKPEIEKQKCLSCGKCMEWCPANAIEQMEDRSNIDRTKCIGCGECLAVCRCGAVKFDWGKESGWMQRAMAEHALGAAKNKKMFFINILANMTQDCDCFGIDQKKIIPDIGILGSIDPVAIDQASLDLTAKESGISLNKASYPNLDGNIQLEHADKIGLGSRGYNLIEL